MRKYDTFQISILGSTKISVSPPESFEQQGNNHRIDSYRLSEPVVPPPKDAAFAKSDT